MVPVTYVSRAAAHEVTGRQAAAGVFLYLQDRDRYRQGCGRAHASLMEGDKWPESAAVRPMAPPAHYYVVCSGYTRSRSMGPPPRAEQSRAGG